MKKLFFTFALVLVAAPAAAQAHDPAAAEALFEDGRQAFKTGDFKTACPKFAESYRLDPAAGSLYNLADCEEHLGAIASAWSRWREFIDLQRKVNPNDKRLPFARQHAAALEPKLPRLRLQWASGAAVPGAKIERDDLVLSSASLGTALPVDPGTHTVRVSAPDHETALVTVEAVAGKTVDVELKPGAATTAPTEAQAPTKEQPQPEAEAPPPTPTLSPALAPKKSGTSAVTVVGWVGAGVGIATLGAGLGIGALVLDAKNTVAQQCDASARQCTQQGLDAVNAGRTYSLISTALTIGGGVLAATGVVLLIVGGTGKHAAKTGVRVLPFFSGTQGGLAMEGRF